MQYKPLSSDAAISTDCSAGLALKVPLDKIGQFSDNRRRIDGWPPEMDLKSLTILRVSGATRRIRTDDLLITNQLLYQLS